MMIKKLTTLNLFSTFINAHNIGSSFTRRELIEYFDTTSNIEFLSIMTIDKYRRLLTNKGYLCHLSRGEYQITKHIPDTLTISQLCK